MKNLNQVGLITALCKELTKQGFKDATPRVINACITAANGIIEELSRPDRPAVPGQGLTAWLTSDETGSSSEFMAHVLCGARRADNNHPHDPSDFGRCLGFLAAVPEARTKITEMKKHGAVWSGLVDHWGELESLYHDEKKRGKLAPKCYAMMREIIREAGASK